MPESQDVPPPSGWAQDDSDDAKTFWTRVKDAFGGTEEPLPASAPPPPPPPPPVSGPRKIQRSVFDREKKKIESRRTRLRRAAREKREGLALVVDETFDRVEKVIVEKISSRDEELSKFATGFVGQAEAMRGIADEIKDQGTVHERVAQSVESVPDLVALVKRGTTGFEDVRGELAIHRAQRERVIEGVTRVEQALALAAEKLREVQAMQEARAREERLARAEEAERMERALALLAARTQEQSSAIQSAQELQAESFRSAQRSLVETFEDSQRRALAALERIEEERARLEAERARREEERQEEEDRRRRLAEEQARDVARRGRRTARVAALVLPVLVGVLSGIGWFALETERDRARAEVAGERSRVEAALEVARSRPTAPPKAKGDEGAWVAPVLSGVATIVPSCSGSSTTLPAGFRK